MNMRTLGHLIQGALTKRATILKARPPYWVTAAFALLLLASSAVSAQTGGEAGIQGTVIDPTGAAVPNAVITATNTATGVATVRVASSDGLYTISPIIPGVYTVEAKAKGFEQFLQKISRSTPSN